MTQPDLADPKVLPRVGYELCLYGQVALLTRQPEWAARDTPRSRRSSSPCFCPLACACAETGEPRQDL